MKLIVQMAMGSNESAVAEMDLKDVEQWDDRVVPVLKRLEARVGDRARRIMAANKQLKDLYVKDPALASLVQNLVLVALGQMPTITTEGLVDDIPNSVPTMQRVEEAA